MMNKLGLFVFLGILVLGVACTVTSPGSSGAANTPQNNDNAAANDNSSDDAAANDNALDDVDVDGEGNVQSVPPAGYYIETIDYGRAAVGQDELTDFAKALGLCMEDLSEFVDESLSAFSIWYNVGDNGLILEVCHLNDQTMIATCSESDCPTSFVVIGGCLIQDTSSDCTDDGTDDGDPNDVDDIDDNDDVDMGDECPNGQYPLYNYASLSLDEYICVDLDASLDYECSQTGTTEWKAEGDAITTHTAMGSMTMTDMLGLCGTQGETLVITQGDQVTVEQTYSQTITSTTQTVEDMGYTRM